MTEQIALERNPLPVKLTVEDYLLLDESGAFDKHPRTELIDGIVYAMNPQYRPHMVAKNELAYRLRRALEEAGNDAFVGTEGSISLSETDLPEPDILVTTEPRGEGPVPASSILLLVEIGHTTLDFDLEQKSPAYAHGGVPEYWVVDVQGGIIHQMWSPDGDAYAERQRVQFGRRIEAATIPGLAVGTTGLS